MSVRTDLRTYTLTIAPYAALVGTRLYWRKLPEGVTYPASTYTIISRNGEQAHDTPVNVPTYRVQFDHFSEDDAEAESLATTLRQGLDGARSGNLQSVYLDNELDDDEFDTQEGLYRIIQDFLVVYKES